MHTINTRVQCVTVILASNILRHTFVVGAKFLAKGGVGGALPKLRVWQTRVNAAVPCLEECRTAAAVRRAMLLIFVGCFV